MYTIQLRNLPEDIYEALKTSAKEARRSMTQQVIYYIEKGLSDKIKREEIARRKATALKEIAQLRKKLPCPLTEDQIVNMIREDRDR